MSRKKRVLFVSEASYLATGYATYSREVLKRLSDRYDVAELSVYGQVSDPRRKDIPWKNYANQPSTEEQRQHYNQSLANQFGAWRFERSCLDFKPDAVLAIRDFWMDSFIRTSPYRRLFKFQWMPTVDAAPQAEEWLATYSECDGIVTYSQFAYDLLKRSCGSKMKLRGVASPCACEDYVPGNNIEAKKALGINPEHQIIGTVMRNQRRKLFPDLFKAFADFINRTNNKDVYLYCHTGYPDHGWDFSKLLIEYGISSRVYFTYKCRCGYYSAKKFSDVVQQCPNCKNFTFTTTNVGDSLSTKDLAKVYQSFDLYCQAANCEGFGIPVVEAAACGIPVCCTDYSAMEDFKSTLTATPIKVKTLYNELETGCNRAIIDTDHLASIFTEFFRLPVELRNIRGYHTRKAYEKNYNWDRTVKQWSDFIDESPFANWDAPPVIRQNQSSLPKLNNNKDLVDWAFSLSCIDDSQLNGYEYLQTLRDLNFGMVKKGTSGFFLPEFSLFDNENYHPMTPEILLTSLNNRINFNNYWERARVGMISLPQEDWL